MELTSERTHPYLHLSAVGPAALRPIPQAIKDFHGAYPSTPRDHKRTPLPIRTSAKQPNHRSSGRAHRAHPRANPSIHSSLHRAPPPMHLRRKGKRCPQTTTHKLSRSPTHGLPPSPTQGFHSPPNTGFVFHRYTAYSLTRARLALSPRQEARPYGATAGSLSHGSHGSHVNGAPVHMAACERDPRSHGSHVNGASVHMVHM